MMRWWSPCVLAASLLLAACTTGTANPDSTAAQSETPIFTGTPEEFNLLVMECLRDRGWEVMLGNQAEGAGTFMITVTPDQEDAYRTDSEACAEPLGVFPPPTRRDLERQYEWLLGQRRCLIEAGYEIDEPPTLEWWLENYNNVETGWDPVGDVGHGLDYQRALAACPRSTESWPEP